MGPVVEGARGRVTDVTDDLLPRISESLSAAGAAVVAEAAKLGVIAAAEEPVLPEPKKKGSWPKRIAIVAAVAAVIALVARKFLGSKDADWQAARPSTPYTPTQTTPAPATPAPGATAATAFTTPVDVEDVEKVDEPTSVADVVVESPANESPVDESTVDESTVDESTVDEAPVDEPLDLEPATEEPIVDSGPPPETPTAEIPEGALLTEDLPAPSQPVERLDALVEPESLADPEETTRETEETDRTRYEGEGVYFGDEPPEGYVIKGNERSKKYHLPESGGYARTMADVWFNSEEAAQAAGFVRAQR